MWEGQIISVCWTLATWSKNQDQWDITTIGKGGYTPGILHIPGTYQGSHQRSFTFFCWCISGICHIPHIHQLMSHLQKIPVCNDIGYLWWCMPGVHHFFWSRRNLLNGILRCMPGLRQVFGSRYSQVKLEGPLLHQPYTSVWSVLGCAGILLVYKVTILAYSWYTRY